MIAIAVAKRIIAWNASTGIEKLSMRQNIPVPPRIDERSLVAERIRKTCNIDKRPTPLGPPTPLQLEIAGISIKLLVNTAKLP